MTLDLNEALGAGREAAYQMYREVSYRAATEALGDEASSHRAQWSNCIQSMVNRLVIERGIILPVGVNNSQAVGLDICSTSDRSSLEQLLPDIFLPDGRIDVYKLVTRDRSDSESS